MTGTLPVGEEPSVPGVWEAPGTGDAGDEEPVGWLPGTSG